MRNYISPILVANILLFFASTVLPQGRMIMGPAECSSRGVTDSTMEGHEQANKGEYEKALVSFSEVIRADPTCAGAYNNLGTVYFQMDRQLEALTAFEMTLRFKPMWAWLVHYNMGRSLASLGRLQEAIKSYNESIKLNGKDGAAYRARAYVNYRLGKSDLAAADAARFLEIKGWRNKNSAYAVMLAFFGFSRSGDKQAARAVLDKAASKGKPSDWPFPVVRYLREEINEQELLSVANDPGKLTEVRTYIGMNLLLSGNKTEAREHFLWVSQNGKKSFSEYSLALSELERIK